MKNLTMITLIDNTVYYNIYELCADLMHEPNIYTLKNGVNIEVFANGTYEVYN